MLFIDSVMSHISFISVSPLYNELEKCFVTMKVCCCVKTLYGDVFIAQTLAFICSRDTFVAST